MRIAVSAGHNVYINNNFDCGSVGSGLREADITKKTVRLLIPMLQKLGHTVLDVTPYNQKFKHSKEAHVVRCKKADDFKADILIDVHINAGGGTGVECWVHNMNSKSVPYATKICSTISKLGLRSRGVKANSGYWTVSLGKTPAIIVEGAFIDNANDMKKLNPSNYAKAICEGITGKSVEVSNANNATSNSTLLKVGSRGADVRSLQLNLNSLGFNCGNVDGIFGNSTKSGVIAFQKANGLSVDGIAGKNTFNKINELLNSRRQTVNNDEKVHRVQVGAFNDRANAEKLSNELKTKGYDNFIN